VKAATASIAS